MVKCIYSTFYFVLFYFLSSLSILFYVIRPFFAFAVVLSVCFSAIFIAPLFFELILEAVICWVCNSVFSVPPLLLFQRFIGNIHCTTDFFGNIHCTTDRPLSVALLFLNSFSKQSSAVYVIRLFVFRFSAFCFRQYLLNHWYAAICSDVFIELHLQAVTP